MKEVFERLMNNKIDLSTDREKGTRPMELK